MQKTAGKNTKYSRNKTILKIGHLAKSIDFEKWTVWVKKLKKAKTCEKRFRKPVRVVLCKRPLEKNTKYLRNETILKIGHLAKAIDFAKWSVCLKNSNGQKRAKNDSASTLELFCAKIRWKNTIYSRNETIFKMGHLAKAIDCGKWSVWLKNSNGQKRAKNDSTSTLELFCAKNR